MKRRNGDLHLQFISQLVKAGFDYPYMEMGSKGLDEKDHRKLRMDHRLLNVDDVKAVLEEKPGHFRDNTNLILSDHRDDIKVLLLQEGMELHGWGISLSKIPQIHRSSTGQLGARN